jgi:hypothetical protein
MVGLFITTCILFITFVILNNFRIYHILDKLNDDMIHNNIFYVLN